MSNYVKYLDERSLNRFIRKVRFTDGCWNWIASTKTDGYGQFRLSEGMRLAHRVSFEWFKYEIPKAMTIDHECENRLCVNPDHLNLMTAVDNIFKTHGGNEDFCPRNHLRRGNTATTSSGHRYCLECKRERALAYYWEKKNAR